ncbi:hypothetical protein [Clostridium perfringens]|uniref:hypothetical protein n=1 Tax=Clostridium perfringens TaxID=1502 RepID=UPI0039EB876E
MKRNKFNTIEDILLKLMLLIPLFIIMYLISIADVSWRKPLIIVTILGYTVEFFMLKFWVYRKR